MEITLQRRLLLAIVQSIAFLLGAVVMGFEMLASRYLYPYFGGGIDTWAALIATVLLALMAGYSLGGMLADRTPNLRNAGLLVGTAAIYILGVPIAADKLLLELMERGGDGPTMAIAASALLLFAPLTLLGTYLPFAIRVIIPDAAHAGRVTGLTYAISTFGNVFGTLLVTFYMIPSFGIRSITMMLGALAALCAMALLIKGRP